ncbi:MAG: hypothetical protein V7637_5458 [Mycobacteriales bacterium]
MDAEDLRELIPAAAVRADDATTSYWIDPAGRVWFGSRLVRGADGPSFRFYRNLFGKDERRCYVGGSPLTGAEPGTFQVLNYTYVTDGRSVWTLGGRLPDADAQTFVVCDRGFIPAGGIDVPGGGRVPYGFGKDRSSVYYYDFDGRPNRIGKATALSFVSLGDGHFGHDDAFVFYGRTMLPKADARTWTKLGPAHSLYSTDGSRIYYTNRRLAADRATFVVLDTADGSQLARDRDHYYFTDLLISASEFDAFEAQAR